MAASKQHIGILWWTATLCLSFSLIQTGCGFKSNPPNIIFILADDLGWNDVGYHGSQIKTPNIDKLANEGVKLENYYVQPVCSPTRSQIMTGRYQIHTGLQHSIIWDVQAYGLPLSDPTVADKLKEAGYATHGVGKWHLGFFKKEYLPTNRGFDSFFGYWTSHEGYFDHYRCGGMPGYPPGDSYCGLDLHNDVTPEPGKNGTYSAHLFSSKVQQIIKEHDKSKPLFVYLPFQSVHEPLEVPEKYENMYQHIKDKNRRVYSGMVSAMDEGIGNITATLKQQGLWENTIIIFSTDNGGQVHQGGNNYPLRGWKTQLWEGGIRGVSFVSGPLLSQTGVSSSQLMHCSDWFPTLLHLAGVPPIQGIDGVNQWQTISEGADGPRIEVLHNIDPLFGMKGKSLYPDIYDTRVRSAIRYKEWKLITGNPGDGGWVPPPGEQVDNYLRFESDLKVNQENLWLFNLKDDPYEHNNLVTDHPEMVQFLLTRLQFYNSSAVPAVYPPGDPNSNPALHGGVWGPWEN